MLISLLYKRRRALGRDCLGPFGKNRVQPKTRQKGEIFSMMRVWYRAQFDLNVLFIHLRTRKKCLFMPLFLLYALK